MKINRKTTEILNHSVDIYNSIIELKYKDAFHLIRNKQTLANTDMSVFPSVYGRCLFYFKTQFYQEKFLKNKLKIKIKK